MEQGAELFYPDLENATGEAPVLLCHIGTWEDKWKL